MSINLPIPLYTVSSNTLNYIAVAGGGGISKTGIRNTVYIFQWEPILEAWEYYSHHTHSEGALMTVSLHPFEKALVYGINNLCFCSTFTTAKFSIKHTLKSCKRPSDMDPESDVALDYETKIVRFAPCGDFFVSASSQGDVMEWAYPSCQKIRIFTASSAVNSLAYSIDSLTIGIIQENLSATFLDKTEALFVPKASIDLNSRANIVKGCHLIQRKDTLYALVMYAVPNKSCHLSLWRICDEKLVKTKYIHPTHHTAFTVSPDLNFVGIGAVDGTVIIVHSKTLRTIRKIQAHDFFITDICFTSDSKQIITVSADYTCKINSVKRIPRNSTCLKAFFFTIILPLLFFLGFNDIIHKARRPC